MDPQVDRTRRQLMTSLQSFTAAVGQYASVVQLASAVKQRPELRTTFALPTNKQLNDQTYTAESMVASAVSPRNALDDSPRDSSRQHGEEDVGGVGARQAPVAQPLNLAAPLQSCEMFTARLREESTEEMQQHWAQAGSLAQCTSDLYGMFREVCMCSLCVCVLRAWIALTTLALPSGPHSSQFLTGHFLQMLESEMEDIKTQQVAISAALETARHYLDPLAPPPGTRAGEGQEASPAAKKTQSHRSAPV
jgi:hypothetical protein